MNCTRCGSDMFFRSYRASGWWTQLVSFGPKGRAEITDTDLSKLRLSREPKTMRCGDCGKRAPNPQFED